MEQSPSWEANWFRASQEIPNILWNPKVHYRSRKCPPTVPILSSSIQSIRLHPTSWRSIVILSAHLRLSLPGGLFPSGFPNKTLCTPILSPISAACSAHLILLDLITRKILDEENKPYNKPYNKSYNKPYNEPYNKPYKKPYNKSYNKTYQWLA